MQHQLLSSFWQIHPGEGKKLYPLMLMIFLICFNYTLVHQVKEVMLLEITKSELISYLKVLGSLPASITFMLIYTRMSVTRSKPFIFYTLLGAFQVGCVALMALYASPQPNPESWALLEGWKDTPALAPIAVAIENWRLVLLYIYGEMYGSVVLYLLFWSFCNEICSVDQGRRWYPLLTLVANVSLVILGILLALVNDVLERRKHLFLQISLGVVFVLGCLTAYIYKWMQDNVLTDPSLYSPPIASSKAKLGLVASIRVIVTSAYILNIAVTVVCCNAIVNFMEVYYKNILNLFWLDATIHAFALESGLTGVMVIILSLFIGGTAVQRFGWTRTALTTPVLFALFGIPFLAIQAVYADTLLRILTKLTALKRDKGAGGGLDSVKYMHGYDIVMPVYVFGLVAVICAKSFRYSFAESTKEMSYIPLDAEIRGKAKAAVDVVGARFGKSGASLIFIGLNSIADRTGTGGDSLGYVKVILGLYSVFVIAWCFAVRCLGLKFEDARVGNWNEDRRMEDDDIDGLGRIGKDLEK